MTNGFQIASSAGAPGETAGHAAEHGLSVVPHHYQIDVMGCTVNLDTLLATWMSMIIAIVLALIVKNSLNRRPDGKQTIAEALVEFVEGLVKGQMGDDNKTALLYVPLVGSIFVFVLANNWFGLLPWRLLHLAGVPMEIASSTNDLNTTAGLAIVAVISYFYYGIKKKGLGYFGHYFTPYPFFLPFNMLEDITRPLSLAFRLFGNIIGGEILLGILLLLVPWFIPLPIFAFEVFVGFIQAFVFAVLTASYIATGVAEHHHDDHGHA